MSDAGERPVMINFNEGYRVRDLDENNYVVERRYTNRKGEIAWTVRGYCSSGEAAKEILLRAMIADRQAKIREEIHSIYDDHTLMNMVMDIPKKAVRSA